MSNTLRREIKDTEYKLKNIPMEELPEYLDSRIEDISSISLVQSVAGYLPDLFPIEGRPDINQIKNLIVAVLAMEEETHMVRTNVVRTRSGILYAKDVAQAKFHIVMPNGDRIQWNPYDTRNLLLALRRLYDKATQKWPRVRRNRQWREVSELMWGPTEMVDNWGHPDTQLEAERQTRTMMRRGSTRNMLLAMQWLYGSGQAQFFRETGILLQQVFATMSLADEDLQIFLNLNRLVRIIHVSRRTFTFGV